METFKEEERNGRMTVVLGGKVLVVDIDFSVDRADPESPKFAVATLRTSYAIPNGVNGASGSTQQGSLSLDGFLAHTLQMFLTEVQKGPDAQDSIQASRLGGLFAEHLSYLMSLDQLALREGDGGLRWFNGIDSLALDIERFATREAEVIARYVHSSCCALNPSLSDSLKRTIHYSSTIGCVLDAGPCFASSVSHLSINLVPCSPITARVSVSPTHVCIRAF